MVLVETHKYDSYSHIYLNPAHVSDIDGEIHVFTFENEISGRTSAYFDCNKVTMSSGNSYHVIVSHVKRLREAIKERYANTVSVYNCKKSKISIDPNQISEIDWDYGSGRAITKVIMADGTTHAVRMQQDNFVKKLFEQKSGNLAD